jgi:hypothetical protein
MNYATNVVGGFLLANIIYFQKQKTMLTTTSNSTSQGLGCKKMQIYFIIPIQKIPNLVLKIVTSVVSQRN